MGPWHTQMTARSHPLIGIDLGGTKTEIAVLDRQHGFLLRERVPTPQHDYASVVANLVELVAMAKRRCDIPPSAAVGIGIPGCVDAQTARVRGANTQVLNGQALPADLAQALGCRVCVDNDANCLALSEAVDGAAADTQVSFSVILGTGCGAGIALGKTLWRGRHALAGEWGHNPLPWPSESETQVPACWCGQRGCIETWLSGPGLAADALRHTQQHRTPEHIVQAMIQGEAWATQTWQRYRDRLARALAQVINLLDPDVIVLGGGMSQVAQVYPGLQALIGTYTFHQPITTPIVPARHGDSSGVRGAAWLPTLIDPLRSSDQVLDKP